MRAKGSHLRGKWDETEETGQGRDMPVETGSGELERSQQCGSRRTVRSKQTSQRVMHTHGITWPRSIFLKQHQLSRENELQLPIHNQSITLKNRILQSLSSTCVTDSQILHQSYPQP